MHAVSRLLSLSLTLNLLLGMIISADALATISNDPVLVKAQTYYKAGKGEAAESLYRAYLKASPNSIDAKVGLAEVLIRYNEFEEARQLLESALRKNPDSADIAAELGRLYHLWSVSPVNPRDYSARAKEHLQQAISVDPNNVKALTYMADWQLSQKDFINADKNYEKALKNNPKFVPAYQGMARYLITVKETARARDTILHAMELDPRDSENYLITAELLAMAEHPAEAITYAQKSESLDFGKLPMRDALLAEQYEKLGELEKSVQYYQRVLALDPNQGESWQHLGRIYKAMNQPDKSAQAFQKAIQMDPGVLNDQILQARQLLRTDNPASALPSLRQLLAMDANNAEAKGAIAGVHYAQALNHNDDAIQRTQDMALVSKASANAATPGSAEAVLPVLDGLKLQIAANGSLNDAIKQQLQGLTSQSDPLVSGEAWYLLGDYHKAQEALEVIDGRSLDEYQLYGDRLFLMRAFNQARTFYQRALELQPDSDTEKSLKQVINRIAMREGLAKQAVDQGNTLYDQKRLEEAALQYQEAIRQFPQSEGAYLRLGDTNERLKRKAEAYTAYEKAVQLNPSLLDSKGFGKKFTKLKDDAVKAAQKS